MGKKTQYDPALWQECEQAYARHGALCLTLQDSHGVNVNLLLLARQLDLCGVWLAPAQWQTLQQQIAHWEQSLLLPYRQLRRLAKSHLLEAEYQQMLALELMLERKSQRLILHKLNQLTPEGTQTNLSSYLGLFGLDAGTYPELSPETA
ncbi:TIGR02444 family protein [Shewanella salipaludis]|uniref:TIGR02444 family protein n=1 Tax=Shewanella salipaludis TaxID=2723052 RepID=A0A972G6E9_9GAMM|nr:TIGR02444 family protein [Shewanella salipaludis]NMH65340.1 TIGR02444 family protein [Shewanella salipaludis]